MKIVGLLSWYEEDPAWLAECVASAARLCDHLIAVDGPYGLFPGAMRKPASGSEQADVIARTAAGAGIGCTIHIPREPWWGGEVEKRDFMFRLGETFTTKSDWYLRIDADEILTSVPTDTRRLLEESEHDAADVMIWERGEPDCQSLFRCLYRAYPGIRIEQAHYIVTAVVDGERRILNGDGAVHRSGPAVLLDVRLEHRTRQRPKHRRLVKAEYYAAMAGTEHIAPFAEVTQ